MVGKVMVGGWSANGADMVAMDAVGEKGAACGAAKA